MSKLVFRLALAILISVGLGASAFAADWRTYRNVRFGFAVDYPADLLAMQPPPANGDGRAFLAQDRAITVTASASHNALDSTIPDLFAQAVGRYGSKAISYRRQGRNYFVVSGIAGGRVFYEFVQIARKGGGEIVGRLVVRYPVGEKPVMDPVVTRMQKSFATSFPRMAPGG